jgi:predicted outer membrane repeat protein
VGCVLACNTFAKPTAKPRGTPVVWYVNELQTTFGDGTTWGTAFNDLQDALDSASSGEEIWVAAGTYLPTNLGGSTDPRDATFNLKDGVILYGGFDGTELTSDERNPELNVTILSGDLFENDLTDGDNSENAKHVVTGTTIDPLTTIDGFTISGGNADGATGGGGLLLRNADGLTINRCLFIGNNSETHGGAFFAEATTDVSIADSSFQSNVSATGGGAIAVAEISTVNINACQFRGNQSEIGGCILNLGDLSISNSLITANLATDTGGSIYSKDSATLLQISNCTITQNIAAETGGGIVLGAGSLNVYNSIIWGNADLSGENEFAQIWASNNTSPIQITHSCVQNMNDDLIGSNNTTSNPRFSSPLGPDGERVTGDEDFRLLATSPCIDSGDNANAVGLYDVLGNTRFIDDPFTDDTNGSGTPPIVDMGAFEYRPTALIDVGGIVIWNANAGEGSFHDATNWFPERVPNFQDIALFNSDAEITITSNVEVSALIVTNGNIEFHIPNIDITIESETSPVRILSYGDNDSSIEFKGQLGRIIIPNGIIQIGGDGDGDDDFDDFFELGNGAELVVGMMRVLDGGVYSGGLGDSSISAEVRNTGGTIDPSALEPGLLEINGDYSSIPQDETDASAKGSLLFTFDDASSSGHLHDMMNISGTAKLGGVLGLQFENNYPTQVGDLFTIITSSLMEGTFDTVWSTGLPASQYGYWVTTGGIRGTGGGGIGGGYPITFGTPLSTTLPGDPNGMVVGDFDGLNGVDIAVVIPNADPLLEGNVVVLLNNGMSAGVWQGFTTSTPIAVGVNPIDIELADLDGDNDIDLVVANYDDDTITTLFNDGSASFTLTTFATGPGPATIAIANYVEDGLLLDDIAVGCDTVPSIITVFQNQSTPGLRGSSFSWINSISIPIPIDIDPGDVNNDKGFDYVVLNSPGDTAWIYEGNGAGGLISQPFGYSNSVSLPSNSLPIAQTFSDLNNDGYDDLVTANNGGGSISILRGNSGSSLDIPSTIPVGSSPEAIAISDLDNDGDDDVVVSVIGATSLQRELLIARNDTSDPATIVLTDIGLPLVSGFVPTHVLTGDFDGNGLDDIVSITELVPLTGHVSPAATLLFNNTSLACASDFNSDGSVAVDDLLQLIGAWGASGGVEDLNGDGTVNVADILILIAAWGPC